MSLKIDSKGIDRYCLYKFDPEILDLFPFFENKEGLKKICDYVMFVFHNDKTFVFVIELKSGGNQVSRQLEATELFMNFILKSAQRIGIKIGKPIIKKIRISNNTILKRPTRTPDFSDSKYGYINYPYSSFWIKKLCENL